MRFLKSLGLLSLFAIAITLTVGCGDKKEDSDKKAKAGTGDTAAVTQVKFDVEGMT